MLEVDIGSIGEFVLLYFLIFLGVFFIKLRGMLYGGVVLFICRIGDVSGVGVDFNFCLVDFGVLKWY